MRTDRVKRSPRDSHKMQIVTFEVRIITVGGAAYTQIPWFRYLRGDMYTSQLACRCDNPQFGPREAWEPP